MIAPAIAAGDRIADRDRALAAWLPKHEDIFEPWRRHEAAPVRGLGYQLGDPWTKRAGSAFFYGPKGSVAYDPVHHIARYHQGCCTWNEVVLVRAPLPPPVHVVLADLSGITSRRGIGLGATPAQVMRAYGSLRLHRSTTDARDVVASYWQRDRDPDCGFFTNFAFRDNRLEEIQSGSGC